MTDGQKQFSDSLGGGQGIPFLAAGVVCHLISKWLDRHDKGNK